eukprot:1002152-Rhodomonas_salina.1
MLWATLKFCSGCYPELMAGRSELMAGQGEEPDLNNECSDDLEKETPEQIDNFVDKLGEWYREYHAWCLEVPRMNRRGT